MKRALLALVAAAALAACPSSVPGPQLDAASFEPVCVRLAAEPGLPERGGIGHRIFAAGAQPSVACRDAAYGAAASDQYRLIDAYQTGRLLQ